jgi:anti-sigma factor ChrR (cupin superfamily)
VKREREHPMGEPAELAALYAAGAMPGEQRAQFEAHLDDCAACLEEARRLDGVVTQLFSATPPAPVAAPLREALLARVSAANHAAGPQVWKRWGADDPQQDLFVLRGEEAPWEPTGIDGIDIRRLFVDRPRNQMTMLVRMEAGTAYPRHVHDGPEECYVLQGELRVGDDTLRAGDYQRAAPGSKHAVQSTDTGCLLLIVSSLTDEILP